MTSCCLGTLDRRSSCPLETPLVTSSACGQEVLKSYPPPTTRLPDYPDYTPTTPANDVRYRVRTDFPLGAKAEDESKARWASDQVRANGIEHKLHGI